MSSYKVILENAERATIADTFDNTKIDWLIMEGMVRG